MVAPLLVALTGPARHEVARVLRAGCPGADPVAGASVEPWWGEVRDYDAACLHVCTELAWRAPGDFASLTREEFQVAAHIMASAVCALPGGDAFLCDQVLPPLFRCGIHRPKKKPRCWWECDHCRQFGGVGTYSQPLRRLAIECREEDAFLLDRVAAWGGQRWDCGSSLDGPCRLARYQGPDLLEVWHAQTWLEAVRAVLPC